MILETVVETKLAGLTFLGRGKVRDIYETDGKLLLVASDRLSAFDVVMPDGIPGKGQVLNQISAFWFRKLSGVIPNHMLSIDVADFPAAAQPHAATLRGRAMLCRKAAPLPIECVVRGYLSGSGWAEYKERGEICGIPLPKGLRESDKLPEPIFTPASLRNQNAEIWLSTCPLPGMPSGITTSNADNRSDATRRSLPSVS